MWAATTPPPAPAQPLWFLLLALVVTLIGGGGGTAALFLVASQRKKNRAETGKSSADGAQAISNAAVGLIKPLEDRIERAETEGRQLRTRLNRADKRINEQGEELAGLRLENRSMRSLLRRIAGAVTGSQAHSDPSGQLTALRELLDEHSHHVE